MRRDGLALSMFDVAGAADAGDGLALSVFEEGSGRRRCGETV